MLVEFPENSADIRITQYEVGTRRPKAELTATLAKELDVSPLALNVPDIDSPIKLIHALFALEDAYGIWIEQNNGAVTLCFDPYNNSQATKLF